MDSNTTLNPKESLQLISETITKAKNDLRQNSFYFLLWGWLVSISSLIHFFLLKFTDIGYPFVSWPILMTLGAIASMVYGYKSSKKHPTESYINYFMKYLWIILGASFFIMVFLCTKVGVNPTPFVLLLAGVGTLVSGFIMKFKPLIIGGFAFLAASIVSVFLSGSDQLVLNAVAVIIGYLVPAYILKNEKR